MCFPLSAEAQIMEESISGRSFLAIQAAIPELESRSLRAADYRITVWEAGSLVIVLFGDPNSAEGQKGNSGNRPALEVELSRDDLRVIRAHFVR